MSINALAAAANYFFFRVNVILPRCAGTSSNHRTSAFHSSDLLASFDESTNQHGQMVKSTIYERRQHSAPFRNCKTHFECQATLRPSSVY